MKKSLIITLLVLLSNVLLAQMHDPVKWTTDVKDLGNNEFQVDFKAKIDQGWFVYSQELEPGGPLPSDFDFSGSGNAKLVGKIKELGKAKEGTDPIFETFVRKYEKSVTFRAKVKTSKPSVSLTVPLTYMSCNDENCVKLDEEFSLNLKASAKPAPAPPKVTPPAPKPPVVKKPSPPPPPPPPAPKVTPPAPKPSVIKTKPAPPPPPAPKVTPPAPVSKPSAIKTTPIPPPPPAPAPKVIPPTNSTVRTLPSTSTTSGSTKSSSGSNTRKATPIIKKDSKDASGGNQLDKGGSNNGVIPVTPSTVPIPATSKDAGGNTSKKATETKTNQEEVAKVETKKDNKEETVANTNDAETAKEETVADKQEETATEEEAVEEAELNTGANLGLLGGDDDGPKIEDPVSWEFSKEELGNNEYMLNFKATIEDGWYIYSQNIEEGGPLPTSVNFEDIKGFEVVGDKAEEVSDHQKKGFDDIFEMEVTKFAKEVSFQQKIKATNPNANIKGYMRFMSCDAEKCLPPQEEEFNFALGSGKAQIIAPAGDDDLNAEEGGLNWFKLFLGGMLGGLLALVTPCVFPMIPLTVSFFTKGSGNKAKAISNALFYGFSIIFIYTGLGSLLALIFGGDILNWMATSPVLNILFFIIFIIFAFSFFGFFELTLPSSFVNKTSSMEDSGGYLGIFFMAATLALVSFSCTGPILGSVLGLVSSSAASSSASSLVLVVVMLGFSIAMALPFTLFAIFPSWLNNLPKSGSWLNTLKVVLGFVEVALAFKFLSTADMVMQWGLIKRETFIILWIIPAVLAGVYLLGKIKFPHDGPIAKLGFGRLFFAGAFFLFALYLGNGLRSEWVNCKNQLSLISGFPPPTFYSYRHQVKGSCNPNHNKSKIEGADIHKTANKAAHCPLDLDCVHDFDEAFSIAEETGKPIFIDFTGWGCVNCRQMEENVWSKPGVLEMLQEDYVVVSLYVDERTNLPQEEQVKYVDYKGRNKTLRTIGDKWTKLQIDCYQSNSQPYYVLLNSKGDMLKKKPIGVASTEKFKNYLAEGLTNYNKNVAEAKPLCNR